MNNKLLVFVSILLLSIGCSPVKSEDHRFFEKNINTLLDSTVFDRRRLVVPSPEDFKDSISRAELKERVKIKKNIDLPPLTVFLVDSLKPIKNLKDFFKKIKQFNSELNYKSIIEGSSVNKKALEIVLNKLEFNVNDYNLRSYSDFEQSKAQLDNQKLKVSPPICSFSRIYFNKEKKLGAFRMSIVFSGLDGHGVIVFIKKENGNWVIDKIIEEWIA